VGILTSGGVVTAKRQPKFGKPAGDQPLIALRWVADVEVEARRPSG
jgi:hypothetical protein